MSHKIENAGPLAWYDFTNSSLCKWFGHVVQTVYDSAISQVFKMREVSKPVFTQMSKAATSFSLDTHTEKKKIVFCADGTWQTPKNNTNVYKLAKAVLPSAGQVVFYDDGVGSDGNHLEKLAGGLMGVGLFEKIKEGYRSIAKSYKPGDDIFIFGFSRGAYTARSLAGMISVCGLPTTFDEEVVEKAFKAYRFPLLRESILKDLESYHLLKAPIKMVGVWDTVGSLGIPSVFGEVGPLYGFLNTDLHPNILNAYHAVAIDEKRKEFPPTLWTSTPVPGQTLEQVWFSGAHGNIGGGYPMSGLSDICLHWMMKKAENLGLEMDPAAKEGYTKDEDHALDKLSDSWSIRWLWPSLRKVPNDSSLSNTVAVRSEQDKSYRPKNLNWKHGALAPSYRIEEIVAPSILTV